jgi:uncharacterized membrane protein YozB (DUF420 family)
MDWVSRLPHVNASLNLLATCLLLIGYALIRQRREVAHRRVMLACFGVSILFLISYVTYHALHGSTRFPSYPPTVVRRVYLAILGSHILLAALVPFLAATTIVLGLLDRRAAHRRLARWTFPIWLYVSVTGVIVYLLLYQLFPPQAKQTTMRTLSISSVSSVGAPVLAGGADFLGGDWWLAIAIGSG